MLSLIGKVEDTLYGKEGISPAPSKTDIEQMTAVASALGVQGPKA